LANGVGVGDRDYCGPDDEYRAALWNRTDQPVTIARGERIAQILILPQPSIELIEDPTVFEGKNRGGFGTTGS
jgi:dUTPase